MNKMLLSALALTALLTACKKDDAPATTNTNTGTGTGPTSSGTITLAGTSYRYGGTGTYFQVSQNYLGIGGTNYTDGRTGITLTLTFPDSVPAAGTYQIYDDGYTLTANQMAIHVAVASKRIAYESIETTGGSATVTLKNGKYSIVVPEVQLTAYPNAENTAAFSMNVTQE